MYTICIKNVINWLIKLPRIDYENDPAHDIYQSFERGQIYLYMSLQNINLWV